MELLNEIYTKSKIYFSNAKIFRIIKPENNKSFLYKYKLFKSFIDFYVFKINYEFDIFSNKEFFDEIISLLNKIYINGYNL